ncbi:MAG: hypothetical protein RL653_3950 [Pseudomonadota bacterium]
MPEGAERDRLRLLPLLFHCIFPDAGLQDAPGVERQEGRGGTRRVARLFGLKPPTGLQNARPLVSAVMFEHPPKPGAPIALLLLLAPGSSAPQAAHVARTAASVEILARRQGLQLSFTVVPPSGDALAGHMASLALFGGLLGGTPPADAVSLALGTGVLTPEELPRLLGRGLDAFCQLSLLCGAGVPLPSGLALVQLGRSTKIISPEAAAVATASRSGETSDLLFPLLAHRARDTRTRQWARAVAPKAADQDPLLLERKLLLMAARAVSRTTGPLRRKLRAAYTAALDGTGLPAGAEAPGALLLAYERGTFELRRGREGQVLARGRERAHAQLRGALLGHAAPELPGAPQLLKWHADSARDSRVLFLVVDSPEQPQVVRAAVRAGTRPSCRVLSLREATVSVLRALSLKRAVDIRAVTPELAPAADRLLRLARLPQVAGSQSAVEVEGRVIVATGGTLREYATGNYAGRPRKYVTDAESWQLNGNRFPGALERCIKAGATTITCFGVGLPDRRRALLVFGDSQGNRFSEQVPVEQLEQRLEETQSLLRAQPQPQLLNIQLEEELLQRVERLSRESQQLVPVKLGGELGKLWLEVRGERFGAGCEWGWDAAAQTLLSVTPVGKQPVVGMSELDVLIRGEQVGGLLRVYVRAAAWRRLVSWMNLRGTP